MGKEDDKKKIEALSLAGHSCYSCVKCNECKNHLLCADHVKIPEPVDPPRTNLGVA